VVAAELVYDDNTTLYGFGSQVDPGETGEISVRIANQGAAIATGVIGTLSCESNWITIADPIGRFGTLGVGATSENSTNRFGLTVAAGCYQGYVATFTLLLTFSSGVSDTASFAVQVGTAATDDPTGPDTYGYYAYDNTDTGYPDAPEYDWIEIASNHSGPGTAVPGLGGDDASVTVDLPFAFTYYGQNFTRATICTNGWIAMGATYLTNYRNWNIPGAGAPPNMIAAMWDNLYGSGDDR
ncbi:MAG: hypothetical protein GY778_31165, partial [bacterium]|nr:hypothetical protein [bacterium]